MTMLYLNLYYKETVLYVISKCSSSISLFMDFIQSQKNLDSVF